MKKFAKLALIALVAVIAATGVLAACQDFTWGPVGSTNPEAAVSGNGTVAVAQGSTVYFVNGEGDTSTITDPEMNWFGNAGYKGSIMKGTLSDDGSVEDVAVLVPKMFYNGQADGGVFVFGKWLYYTSPSTETQSDGTILTSRHDFYRTTTDGTQTQLICTADANTYEYIFTPSALFYFNSALGQIVKVGYTDAEVGASEVIAEDVTDAMFVKDGEYTYGEDRVSDMFFYTKAGDTQNDFDVLYGNRVYACNYAGKSVLLIDNTTFVPEGEGVIAAQHQYTVSLLDYAIEDGGVTLVYSRTPGSSSVSGARTATSMYTVTPAAISEGGEGAVLNAANEKVIAYSALSASSVYAVSAEYGVLSVSSSNINRYYNDNGTPVTVKIGTDGDGTQQALEGAPTIVAVRDEVADATNNNTAGKYMYYTVSNALYKFNLDTEQALGMVLDSTTDTVYTDYIAASLITRTVNEKAVTYFFYMNGITGDYTSVAALSTLNYAQEGGEWTISGVVASGYWEVGEAGCTDSNYSYNEEDKTYTVTDPSDATKTVTITKPLPKFMESAGLGTYISAYTA